MTIEAACNDKNVVRKEGGDEEKGGVLRREWGREEEKTKERE